LPTCGTWTPRCNEVFLPSKERPGGLWQYVVFRQYAMGLRNADRWNPYVLAPRHNRTVLNPPRPALEGEGGHRVVQPTLEILAGHG
jgi:hypothetical protein